MSSARSNIRAAAVVVATKIKAGQQAELAEELSKGDLTGYVELAAMARLRKDTTALRRTIRDAVIDLAGEGHQVQLVIPGLGHAGLPFIVFDGSRAIPASHATLDQIDAEIAAHERRCATRGRIIGGWRATVDALRDQGVDGAETGAAISAKFRPAEAITDAQ